jgi:3'-phosphoadenosine 5'-phosphosulfate sulfotransferase (PAPS reductase)/FAD synthetase
MTEQIVKAYDGKLPEDVFLNFNNTGKEREETLVFVNSLSKRWGVPITWIEFDATYGMGLSWKIVDFETASREGEPFDKVLTYYARLRDEEKAEPAILPNPVNRMCTDRMKIKASAWWMKGKGYDEWDAIMGIRADEQKRAARMMADDKNRWTNVLPMYTSGVVQADVQAYWASQDIDLGIHSDMGNCDLCFLKHERKILRAIRKEPWRAVWWIKKEEETGQPFRRDRASYRQLAWTAEQMNKQMRFDDFPPSQDEEESAVDCVCGDGS